MSKFSKLKREILTKQEYSTESPIDTTIHLNINSSNDAISPYSEDNKLTINSEFASFLENSVKDIPVKNNLTLEISSKNCDINMLSEAIKNYYYNEFIDSQRKLKRNLIFSLVTFIIGLLGLAFTMLYDIFDFPIIVIGALDIFTWVFMWEAFDKFFFERTEFKYNQYRQMNFINAKIIAK